MLGLEPTGVVSYPYKSVTGQVEFAADNVRSTVLGNDRAPADLMIKYARKAGWIGVDEREASAALLIECIAGKKARKTVLASAIGYVSDLVGVTRQVAKVEA